MRKWVIIQAGIMLLEKKSEKKDMEKKKKTKKNLTVSAKRKMTEKMEKFLTEKEVVKETVNDLEKTKKTMWLAIGVMAVILLVGGAGGYYYFYHSKNKQAKTGGNNPASGELAGVLTNLGKILELPEEEPTLATVTDISKISSQPFFAKAQNGDKVLIFTQAKKAILYRPGTGKIIEVMTVSGKADDLQNSETSMANPDESSQPPAADQNQENQETSQRAEQAEPTRVAVYNGARRNGLAQAIGDKITILSGFQVTQRTNAVGSYPKTLVIDLSGDNGDLVQQIIAAIGGEAGELPAGETRPEASILIIGGSDYKK